MTQGTDARVLPRPAHVPEALVYDFDLFTDAGLLADPHERLLDIVENAPPIFWTPRKGGNWVFAGHEAVFEGARDWNSFTSETMPLAQLQAILAQLPPGTPRIPLPIPINVDPPMHGNYRLPLNTALSPKAIDQLKDSIRALARELIEHIRPAGKCEFMSEVAEPMPVQVFLKLLGLPVERQTEYRQLVLELMRSLDDPNKNVTVMQKVAAIMRPTLEERRKAPKDDLISLLWSAEPEGRAMTMDDMENYGVLLFLAGLDTVMNSIGLGVRHLAVDLELQDKLRADPSLIAEAAEELLRRYTFTVPARAVARDLVFQGVEMKAGDRVDLLLPAANLDPKRFERPGQCDVGRDDKVHIAFSAGPHRCVGSHLARIELQILYEELLLGLPTFQLDPAKPPTFHGGRVMGLDHLHLIWKA